MMLGLPDCQWKQPKQILEEIQTQNLEVSTSGETIVLSFNLQEKGQGLGKGAKLWYEIREIARTKDK
jgi:hypothetical protein